MKFFEIKTQCNCFVNNCSSAYSIFVPSLLEYQSYRDFSKLLFQFYVLDALLFGWQFFCSSLNNSIILAPLPDLRWLHVVICRSSFDLARLNSLLTIVNLTVTKSLLFRMLSRLYPTFLVHYYLHTLL